MSWLIGEFDFDKLFSFFDADSSFDGKRFDSDDAVTRLERNAVGIEDEIIVGLCCEMGFSLF